MVRPEPLDEPSKTPSNTVWTLLGPSCHSGDVLGTAVSTSFPAMAGTTSPGRRWAAATIHDVGGVISRSGPNTLTPENWAPVSCTPSRLSGGAAHSTVVSSGAVLATGSRAADR